MSEEFVDDIISATVQTDEGNKTVEGIENKEPSIIGDAVTAIEANSSSSPTIEDIAAKLGWRSDHVGEDAVDAATYILRSKDIQKSMSQHNKDLKNQLSVLNGSVEALKIHNERVYQAEVKKLQAEVTELKKERKAAIELADVAKVEELDTQIADIQKDIDTPKEDKTSKVGSNDVFETWVKDNEWYLKDPEMATYADAVAQNYVGAPLERIYSLVLQKVQEVFPDKFTENKASKEVIVDETKPIGPASPVERSINKGNSTTFTEANLTQAQIAIMNQFANSGVMSKEQYINDIAKMQG